MERSEYEEAMRTLIPKLEADAMPQTRIDFTWDLHSGWLSKLPVSALTAVLARFDNTAHYNTTAAGLESAIEALMQPHGQTRPQPVITHDVSCCERGFIFKYKGTSQYIFGCAKHSMRVQAFPVWIGQVDFLDFPHCEHKVDIKNECRECVHKNQPHRERTNASFQNQGNPFE